MIQLGMLSFVPQAMGLGTSLGNLALQRETRVRELGVLIIPIVASLVP